MVRQNFTNIWCKARVLSPPILPTKITAAQNEIALSYHTLRKARAIFSGSYFRGDYTLYSIHNWSHKADIPVNMSVLLSCWLWISFRRVSKRLYFSQSDITSTIWRIFLLAESFCEPMLIWNEVYVSNTFKP